MNDKKHGAPVAANDNNAHRFYVYAWLYPDGRTFYVGKGQFSRDTDETGGRNKLFKRIVAKIRQAGGEPRIVRWQDHLREEDAFRLEMAYIKLFGRRDQGRGALANLTDGGEGPVGLVHSPETRKKMRDAHLGVSLSEEHRAKLAEANRNPSHERRAKIGDAHRGKTVGVETRTKLREANLGKTLSAEHRAKISASQVGKIISPDHRAKLGTASRLRWHDEEIRARMLSPFGKVHTPESVSNMRAAQRMKPPRGEFKGVVFHKTIGKWAGSIKLEGKQKHLGVFSAPADAARAYDAAAIEAWGLGNCYLNFPEEFEMKEAE